MYNPILKSDNIDGNEIVVFTYTHVATLNLAGNADTLFTVYSISEDKPEPQQVWSGNNIAEMVQLLSQHQHIVFDTAFINAAIFAARAITNATNAQRAIIPSIN